MRNVIASLGILEAIMVLVVLVAAWGPGAVTVAKGHVALFVAGLLTIGLIWLIAALRLAKPNSPWAKRFYGPEKLARSRNRYPDIDSASPSRAGLAAAIGFGALGLAFMAGLVGGLAS